ncbi:hypothetical protein LMG28614_04141 [Paraburkholderia ultramafica]|uniref:Uncharacterized protein n=1 Tax=Paraburkholderia ultramafica TaxID=1544867 RepID=A0A6S7BC88_9BURK|nr:hypothetical protein [Paraburkholderia ultramafica]CAB3795277.1 hypothetical protein LMG28614_04141 [Paraburkholderia ultramafica]
MATYIRARREQSAVDISVCTQLWYFRRPATFVVVSIDHEAYDNTVYTVFPGVVMWDFDWGTLWGRNDRMALRETDAAGNDNEVTGRFLGETNMSEKHLSSRFDADLDLLSSKLLEMG